MNNLPVTQFKPGDRVRLTDPGMIAYIGRAPHDTCGVVIEAFSQSAVVLWDGAQYLPFDGDLTPAHLCLIALFIDLVAA